MNRGLVLALAVLAVVGAFGLRAALRGAERELTVEERLRADERLRPLIYDCQFGKHFDAPTVESAVVELLVSKLERGARDPLRSAKQELAEIGEPAIEPMRRLFNRVYQDAFRHGVVENVLGVCSLMDEPWGIEMIRLGIVHPQETVRIVAVAGMRKHGTPQDYEEVLKTMPVASTPQTRADYAACLEALDPERFQGELTAWLEEGRFSDVWTYVILSVSSATDPELVRRLRAVAEVRDETLRPFLIAPAARAGDTDALDELHGTLAEGRPADQQMALRALAAIGRALDGLSLARHQNAGVRRTAFELLVEEEPDEKIDVWLQEGIDDGDPKIRELCLRTLVGRGNEYGRGRALRMLEGNSVARSVAIGVLREAWDANPGAAEEAFARLIGMYHVTAHDPPERLGVLQTISQVPLRDAADFLMDLARQGEGRIKGKDAHRFLTGQVWNTGDAGRDLLRAELLQETDPFRRLSLIEFVWQDHSDASREVLLGIVQDTALNPFERLYAADRLVRVGPAKVVAPILKRVYKETTDAVLRPALQCLLWTWYGQHYE